MSKKKHKLRTRTGSYFHTDRVDSFIWDAYFSSKDCRVEIVDNLFKIIPQNKNHPAYYIKGTTHGLTYDIVRHKKNPNRDPLLNKLENAENQIYSGKGEDGVVNFILRKIPVTHKFVVEFGAFDGIWMSNSRNLIKNEHWQGFLIEASKKEYKKLHALYKNSSLVTTLCSFVTEENINQLFKNAKVPYDFDVLSIDIDSIDYYVWKGLTEFKPKLVLIEYNASFPPDQEYIMPKTNAKTPTGASILSLYKLGLEKGYCLVYGELSGCNLFFVAEEYMKYLDNPLITIADVYQPPQFGLLAGGIAPNGRGENHHHD